MNAFGLALISATATVGIAFGGLPAHANAAPVATNGQPSEAAVKYLDTALELMQRAYLHRAEINWTVLRARGHAALTDAQSEADAHDAVRTVITVLGDAHAAFHTPAQRARDAERGQPQVRVELIDGRFGYLHLPRFSGAAEDDAAIAYAARAHRLQMELDNPAPCGWIVDLRDNTGGNMWPMLAAVGPLLGNGAVGAHVGSLPEERAEWQYRDGAVTIHAGQRVNTRFRVAEPAPDQSDRPVAVLLSDRTASAAEAVAIAFVGRPGARRFGTVTAGFATGNASLTLSDGALLVFPFAYSADRTGTVHFPAVAPDEALAPDEARAKLPPTVVAWLAGQPGCAQTVSPRE